MKKSITTSLRKAISQVAPNYPIREVFSDPRVCKTAVGVKIVGKPFTKEQLDEISFKMRYAGWEEIAIKRNERKNSWSNGYFNGTRFTYYK